MVIVELPRCLLAGMLGTVKDKIIMHCLSADVELRRISTRCPRSFRSAKQKPDSESNNTEQPSIDSHTSLSQAEQKTADASFLRLLSKGIPLAGVNPFKQFEGAKVFLADDDDDDDDDDRFLLGRTRKLAVDWDTLRFINIVMPVSMPASKFASPCSTHIEPARFSPSELITMIMSQPNRFSYDLDKTSLTPLLTHFHLSLPNVISKLHGFPAKITMCKLDREGGGLKTVPSTQELGAYHCILYLVYMFPSAIRFATASLDTFDVVSPEMLFYLRQLVVEIFKHTTNDHASSVSVPMLVPKNEAPAPLSRWPPFVDKLERHPYPHQESIVSEMQSLFSSSDQRSFYIYMPVGSGKTFMVIRFIQFLSSIGKLPKFIVFAAPESALQTIEYEFRQFSQRAIVFGLGSSTAASKKNASDLQIKGNGTVIVIGHDQMKKPLFFKQLVEMMPDSFFILDEAHKILDEKTVRTQSALQLQQLSCVVIAMSATAIINTKINALIQLLRSMQVIPISPKNYFVAVATMLTRKYETDVKITSYTHVVDVVNPGQYSEHLRNRQFIRAFDHCITSCDQTIISLVCKALEGKRRVFIVAWNKEHQQRLKSLIDKALFRDNAANVCRMIPDEKTGASLNLTDFSEESDPSLRKINVVITTIHHSAGYRLTTLSTLITCVYPSNQATRSQLAGRLIGVGQRNREIEKHIVMSGAMVAMYERHYETANLEACMREIASAGHTTMSS